MATRACRRSVLGALLAAAAASPAVAHEPGADSTNDAGTVGAGDRVSRIAEKFHGSILLLDQSISPDTVDKGAQLSRVPSYQWWISFRPRYYVTPKLSLRLRADLTTEWLNAADTTRKREPQVGDLWADAIYELPHAWGITPTVGVRTLWPTSKDSRADSTVVKAGPVLGLLRPFTGTAAGDFELSLGGYGAYNFVEHTSGGVRSPYACAATDFSPTTCGENTGLMNARVTGVWFAGAKYAPKWLPDLSLSVSYIGIDTWAYRAPDATLHDATGGVTVVPSPGDTTVFRQSSWILASLDYDVTKWLSFSLGYYSLRPVLDPDGTYGNPFYKPGGNSRVFFTTTFTLDQVYTALAR